MTFDTDTRYDAEPETQTIIGADDPQPPAAIQTQTAAQLAALATETMDPAPAPKNRKGKPAAAKVPVKAKAEPLYAVLDMEAHTYRFVTVADLQAVARQIEGQPHQILYRLVPQVVNINVEITE